MSKRIHEEMDTIEKFFDGLRFTKITFDPKDKIARAYFTFNNRKEARAIYNYSKITNSIITNQDNEKVTSGNCYKYGKGSIAIVNYNFTNDTEFSIKDILVQKEIA